MSTALRHQPEESSASLPTALDLIAADPNINPAFRQALRIERGSDRWLDLREEEDSRADDARDEAEGEQA